MCVANADREAYVHCSIGTPRRLPPMSPDMSPDTQPPR
jgi:hypothetical protein